MKLESLRLVDGQLVGVLKTDSLEEFGAIVGSFATLNARDPKIVGIRDDAIARAMNGAPRPKRLAFLLARADYSAGQGGTLGVYAEVAE